MNERRYLKRDPSELVLQIVVNHPMWVLTLGPLEVHQVLLITELSLQGAPSPQPLFLIVYGW